MSAIRVTGRGAVGLGRHGRSRGRDLISKAGITSTTFKTVPDVPIDSFELTLPEGAGSALAANGNLRKGKLVMPTNFLAQNGLEINQQTPIKATGRPKARKAGKHRKKGKRKAGRRTGKKR